MFFAGVIAGDRPSRDGEKKRVVYRRARAFPRHAAIGTRNGVSRRAFFAQIGRSRGTGPRATGQEGVFLATRRSGSGDPELQSYLANRDNLVNPAPAWHGEGLSLALQTGGRPHLGHACN